MQKIIIWTAVIIAGLIGVFMVLPTAEEAERANVPTADPNDVGSNSIVDADPIDIDAKPKLYIGDPNAPVTLVEYGDFKCPSCNAFHHGAGRQLREEYVDNGLLKIEFRNFPFIATDSGRTARGAYCAQAQNAFAPYHDKIYEYIWAEHYAAGDYSTEFIDIYTTDKIIEVVGDSVADPAALRACIDSDDQDVHVDADIALASQDGIQGTPGFVLNGQRITGPSNFMTFKTLIDAQL